MENKSAGFFKHSSGFTLVELLVAITIIGVLSSIVAMGYAGQLKKARDGKRKADLENIRSALEIYRSDCGAYPTSGAFPFGTAFNDCHGNQDMATVPNDPSGGNYSYVQSSSNSYSLCANLEVCSGCPTNLCSSYNYKVTNP